MTVYTYGELEQLWINAGGPKDLAALMAAIAEAESSGNSDAYNASGATGLWQILGAVNPSDQSSLKNPQTNAKEAVLKYKSQGLGAWVTYTSGAYRQFLKGNVPPDASVKGASSGSTPNPSSGTSSGTTAGAYSDLGVGGIVSGATGLLKDVATVLDYVFGMFGRGQGWRMIFVLVAAGAAYMSYKSLTAGAVSG